jgi:dTDP-4-amino-4,6-dideoxygalactose transaminase
VVRPTVHHDAQHVFHLYVIEVDDRDRVLARLHERGIGAGVHYPVPLHEQPAYRNLGYRREELPVTYASSRRILSLPIYPELTRAQAERVASAVNELVRP